jgi:hypothetical protein
MDVMFGVVECVVGAKGAMQQQIGVSLLLLQHQKLMDLRENKTEKISV